MSLWNTFLDKKFIYCVIFWNILAVLKLSTMSHLVFADDNMDFFSPIELAPLNTEKKSLPFDFQSYIQQDVKYGWQSPPKVFQRNKAGLSQVKTHAYVKSSGKWTPNFQWQASVKGEGEWIEWTDNKLQWALHDPKVFLKDFYIDLTLENGTWFRVGHQVIAWGESESLPIIDVISPVDQREPGQLELQDLREQVPALLVSLPFTGKIKATAVVTYQAGHNRYAGKGEGFDVRSSQLPGTIQLLEDQPDSEWEYVGKLEAKLNAMDINIVAAVVNDNELSFTTFDGVEAAVHVGQRRLTIYGINANTLIGGGVLRSEFGYIKNAAFPNFYLSTYETENQTRSMISYDYAFGDSWQLALEMNNTYIPKNIETGFKTEITSYHHFGYMTRLRHTAMNERLVNQFWIIKLGVDDAKIAKWKLTYDWSDQWQFGLGLVSYKFGHRPSILKQLENHDSVNIQMTFSM